MSDKPKRVKILAFDIETHGLGGDAIYCSYSDGETTGGSIVNRAGYPTFTEFFIREFLRPKYQGYIIVAHNGIKFDYLRLDWLAICDAGYDGRFFTAKNKNNIRGINLRRGKKSWKLRDSMTYFNGKLAEFSELFGNGELKGELDFKRESFDIFNPRHIRYAKQDARSLWHSCRGFDSMLNERFNVGLNDGVTLSGFGFRAMKKQAKANGYGDMPYLKPEYENAVRSSYHGGFTCAFHVGKFENLHYLDINSAYGHAMERYPMPSGACMLSRSPADEFNLTLATVVFNDAFPYLISKPYSNKHAGRYAGTVIGWFWDFELDLQAEMGADITHHCYLVWPHRDTRIIGFIKKCKSLRYLDYDGPLGKMAKLLQNSIYGKCGAQQHETDIELNEEPPDNATPVHNEVGDIITGLWEKPARQNQPGTMVHWASYITARARWQLMRYLLRVPRRDWIYCDTDSLIVPSKYAPMFEDVIGDEYGELEIVGVLTKFHLRAPKTYRGEMKSGELKTAAKGIPGDKFDDAWETGRGYYEGMRSLYHTMQGKLRSEHNGRYSRKTSRALSSPSNVSSGFFDDAGYWQPGIARVTDPERIIGHDAAIAIYRHR